MRSRSSTRYLPGYEHAVDEHPLLTREQEQELFRRYADGDDDARETILLSNVQLVVKVCGWHMREGMLLEDLVQDGMVGLMTAVEKYEVERGLKSSTYATWWIRQAVQKTVWERATWYTSLATTQQLSPAWVERGRSWPTSWAPNPPMRRSRSGWIWTPRMSPR